MKLADYATMFGQMHNSRKLKTVPPPVEKLQTGEIPLRFMSADRQAKFLKELLVDYDRDVRAGWRVPKNMQAKAPPGWEGTVRKMKGHPKIGNPYALAWYMKDKGYQSHE